MQNLIFFTEFLHIVFDSIDSQYTWKKKSWTLCSVCFICCINKCITMNLCIILKGSVFARQRSGALWNALFKWNLFPASWLNRISASQLLAQPHLCILTRKSFRWNITCTKNPGFILVYQRCLNSLGWVEFISASPHNNSLNPILVLWLTSSHNLLKIFPCTMFLSS